MKYAGQYISFIGKVSSDCGLLSKTKFNIEESQHQAVYFDSYEKIHNLKS